ncbi:hypothetical protein PENTCL1PPCAC_24380, partial [Pristionchus entomophagus]
MFFGEFEEKDMDQIELKEVVYEEFINLLLIIFPTRTKITDSTVNHLLALSDEFQIDTVRMDAETHLLSSSKSSTIEKMALADQFRLVKLMNNCLQSYSNLHEIKALMVFLFINKCLQKGICGKDVFLCVSVNFRVH